MATQKYLDEPEKLDEFEGKIVLLEGVVVNNNGFKPLGVFETKEQMEDTRKRLREAVNKIFGSVANVNFKFSIKDATASSDH